MLLKQNIRDDDLENLFVTFLCVVFIGNTMITSADDGFLYLWDEDRIVRRIFAHEAAIFALHQNSKLGLLVSGSLEGTVILWRLLIEKKSNIKSLEKLRSFNLRRNLDP
jgi:WD40 repeat protein